MTSVVLVRYNHMVLYNYLNVLFKFVFLCLWVFDINYFCKIFVTFVYVLRTWREGIVLFGYRNKKFNLITYFPTSYLGVGFLMKRKNKFPKLWLTIFSEQRTLQAVLMDNTKIFEVNKFDSCVESRVLNVCFDV